MTSIDYRETILYWLHRKIKWLPFLPPFPYGYWASRACPDNEPLHFHHDGCPHCDMYGDPEFGVTGQIVSDIAHTWEDNAKKRAAQTMILKGALDEDDNEEG